MEDLAIKNGIIFTPNGSIRGGLTIAGGKISCVGNDDSLPKARQEIDARGLPVLPCMIDPHMHLGGAEEAVFVKQCRSESISAALGGVTTMMSYVRFGNALEPRLGVYRKAREIGPSNSYIDFKVHAYLLNENHLNEVDDIMAEGVNTFKLMMGYSTHEARQIGLEAIDWGFAYRVFEIGARLGPPALVQIHCEEPQIIAMLQQRLMAEGRDGLAAWADARPSLCEAMHIFDAGLLAQELGTHLYIVHTSAKESVDAIGYLKAKGVRIYGEACTHHLLLNRNAAAGILAKVNPPLRDEADQIRLWQGLQGGVLDTMGSDHVPQIRENKMSGGIWGGAPGFGGAGATLAVLVSEGVNKGRLTWEQLVKITSENTAKIFHIYPQKGALSPGSDADLVIIDPNMEWTLSAQALQSGADYSVYEGTKVKGKAVMTFVRGRLIAKDGQLVAEAPGGEYVFASW